MNHQTSYSPFGGLAELITTPPALIAGLVLVCAGAARTILTSSLIGMARSGNYALFGMTTAGMNLVIFLLTAAIYYVLARKLGDADGKPGKPSIGLWIGLMLFYGFITNLVTAVLPMIFFGMGSGDPTQPMLFPALMSALFIIMRLIFFPLITFLIALTHGGGDVTFGRIARFLFGHGFGWLATYALLSIVVTAVPFGLSMGLRSIPGFAASIPAMLLNAVFIAIGQLLLIVFAIATYRAVCADTLGDETIFN